jgi:predicted alpha/beta superfamily hydrolase
LAKKATPIPGLNASFFDIKAKSNGENYRIYTAASGFWDKNKQAPVIYLLDGNYQFGRVMETSRSLWMEAYIPAALVVGIGYTNDDYAFTSKKRVVDYTPDSNSDSCENALRFLDFIENELKPIIEGISEVSIDPNDSTIIGHSLGGLFATWALLTRPDIFKRYISISPSLLRVKSDLPDWLGNFNHLDSQRHLYSVAGALEDPLHKAEMIRRMEDSHHPLASAAKEEIFGGAPANIPKDLAEFEISLTSKQNPLLRNRTEILPNESHNTIVSGAISRGLRYVFAPTSM